MKRLITLGIFANATTLLCMSPGAPPSASSAPGGGLSSEEVMILQEILSYVVLADLPDGEGGTVPAIRLEGVNLQLVNGLGATNGNPGDVESVDNTLTNGTGNLIIGYQELRATWPSSTPDFGCNGITNFPHNDDVRTGSHNLVVGGFQNYESFGGVIAGQRNWTKGAYATVTGGWRNLAEGNWSNVSGGTRNIAYDRSSSVLGGLANGACGVQSAVVGGVANGAGTQCVVLGGLQNQAYGNDATVSGGFRNQSNGVQTSVAGGSDVVVNSDFMTGTRSLRIHQ